MSMFESKKGFYKTMTGLLFVESVTFLIVSPSGVILEEMVGSMWVSILPFSSDVVKLTHGEKMTSDHLLSYTDERVEFDLRNAVEDQTVGKDVEPSFAAGGKKILSYTSQINELIFVVVDCMFETAYLTFYSTSLKCNYTSEV